MNTSVTPSSSQEGIFLTSDQRNEIAGQFADLVIDNMDYKTMEQYIYDNMMEYFSKLTVDELEEEVHNHDDELWEELVDNVRIDDIQLQRQHLLENPDKK